MFFLENRHFLFRKSFKSSSYSHIIRMRMEYSKISVQILRYNHLQNALALLILHQLYLIWRQYHVSEFSSSNFHQFLFLQFIFLLQNGKISRIQVLQYQVSSLLLRYSKSKSLKLVSAIFYQIFIFSPNDCPSKTQKNVFYFI